MMKRKGLIFRLGAVALVLTLITSSLTSGTLAKYASERSVGAEAVVARWAFQAGIVEGGSIKQEITTVNLRSYTGTSVHANGNTLASGVIAPGVSGEIPIQVSLAGSQVGAKVEVLVYNATTDGQVIFPDNLVFKRANDESLDIATSTNTTPVTVLSKTVPVGKVNDTIDASIKFEWPFESSEIVDQSVIKAYNDADMAAASELADAKRTIKLTIIIRATQLAPNANVSSAVV